ncbi:hypothetical protein EGW08_002669, partial [Elysia chlorotica]
MMEEEEDTLFDQDHLLGRSDEASREKSEQKRKLAKTGSLSLAFFCLGLCIAIPGPTLLDLGKTVGRDTQHMVLVFTARSLGYLLGSVGGGILGDLWDQQLLLALTLGLTAVATIGVPWCSTLVTMAILISVHGVAIGVLDSGGNVFCIRIWGKQSPSYMQLLHFAFGVGAFLAPLVAYPFLSDSLSYAGSNRSIALPYTFEIQALNSLPDTIAGKSADADYHQDVSTTSRPGSGVNISSDANNNNTVAAVVTTTLAPPPPPQPVPKKPRITDGESLSPKHADGEPNNSKLSDLIRNPQKILPEDIPESGVTTPAPPSTASPPSTSSSTTTTTTTIPSTSDHHSESEPSDSDPQSKVSPPHEAGEDNSEAVDRPDSNSTTTNSTALPQDTLQFFFETVRNMSKIQFAYLVIGLLLAVNSFVFCSLYTQDRAAHRSGPISTPLSHEELTRPPKSACFVFTFLGFLFLFFLIYVGMEVTYGGLLPTFALGFPGVVDTPAGGATLVAMFWGSLALGRGMGIFVARWFKPPCMMVVDLSLTMAGALVLVLGISAQPKLLWVGTVTLGLGMSTLFPTAMSWAHTYHPLSGRSAAVFVAGCGVGEMTVPALTGQLYHSADHMALMYVMLACASLLVLIFLVLQVLALRG